MNVRKPLLLTLILFSSVLVSSVLIWQGFNLDNHNLVEDKPKEVTKDPSRILGQSKSAENPASPSATTSPSAKLYKVTKVIDGDTFEFKSEGVLYKVRLIGIDTPETVDPRRPVGCFGKNASNETKRLIEGKEVILTKDISETDKYNRLLRYVFLPISNGENLFVNDYLVRQGFAKASSYPPDIKYNDRFSAAEREARENLRGLWGECK